MNGTIKFEANLLPAPVNEDTVAAIHKIGKIQLRNIDVINDGFISGIDLKIVRPKFDLNDIPKKLGGLLGFHFGEARTRGIKKGRNESVT